VRTLLGSGQRESRLSFSPVTRTSKGTIGREELDLERMDGRGEDAFPFCLARISGEQVGVARRLMGW